MDATEVDLACALLEDAFGPLVSRVARVLMLHKAVSFLELRELLPQGCIGGGVKQQPSFSPAGVASLPGASSTHQHQQQRMQHDAYCRLRNALLVLLQHNMLSCSLSAPPPPVAGPASSSSSCAAANHALTQVPSASAEAKTTPEKEPADVQQAAVLGQALATDSSAPCAASSSSSSSSSSPSSSHPGGGGGPSSKPSLLSSNAGGTAVVVGGACSSGSASSSPPNANPAAVSHGGVRYSLVMEGVLALLWFPAFVAAAEEIHGSDAGLLLLQILKAGRLCMQDAVALAMADFCEIPRNLPYFFSARPHCCCCALPEFCLCGRL